MSAPEHRMPKSSPTLPAITVSHDGGTTSYTTAAAAFDAALAGDTVTFGSGTYDVGSLQITHNDLTIQGVRGTVLNGGLQVDAAVTELTVQDLTITNGAVADNW